jgi:hypothetical protein
MSLKSPVSLLDVQEHCALLGQTLAELWQNDPTAVLTNGNESLEYPTYGSRTWASTARPATTS